MNMTTLLSEIIICPVCKKETKVLYYPSICTWLNPELIQEIYDEGYYAKCAHCSTKMPIVGNILINAPRGMFMLDTGLRNEIIRTILKQAGIVDEKGQVLDIKAQSEMRKEEWNKRKKLQSTTQQYFL